MIAADDNRPSKKQIDKVPPITTILETRNLNQIISVIPNGWKEYTPGVNVPTGFIIHENVLIPTEEYNSLVVRGILQANVSTNGNSGGSQDSGQDSEEMPSHVLHQLKFIKLDEFSGSEQNNAELWINTVQTYFKQVKVPEIF